MFQERFVSFEHISHPFSIYSVSFVVVEYVFIFWETYGNMYLKVHIISSDLFIFLEKRRNKRQKE